jgi:catalase
MRTQMIKDKKLTNNAGGPVADNQNIMTKGPRDPALLHDVWFLEKLGHFDMEVIPELRMHAKGSGAYGSFTKPPLSLEGQQTTGITGWTMTITHSRTGFSA